MPGVQVIDEVNEHFESTLQPNSFESGEVTPNLPEFFNDFIA